MKPNWDDAPEWAEWLAMDEDGNWFWYELEPWYAFSGRWRGREFGKIEVAKGFRWWHSGAIDSLESRQ